MSNKRMNIHILYENETILKLRVRSLDKVSHIKERVGARTQLDPQTISLEYNGKELHESLKLDHCGVNEDGMSVTLTIIESTPMEEIPWHAPCANMGGSTPLIKDLHASNRGNGDASKVACQNVGSSVSKQDSAGPNFIDSRTHCNGPCEDTFRPQSNSFGRIQRKGQN